MSRYVNQTGCQFYMDKIKEKDAYEALIALKTKPGFEWMKQWKTDTFQDLMSAIGYSVEGNKKAYDWIEYLNEKEDYKTNQYLSMIAPFVEEGSFIEWRSEDGDLWRTVFTEGTVKDIYPEIHWPMPEIKEKETDNEYEERE